MGFQSLQSYNSLLDDNYILINPNIPYQYSNKSSYEVFDRFMIMEYIYILIRNKYTIIISLILK